MSNSKYYIISREILSGSFPFNTYEFLNLSLKMLVCEVLLQLNVKYIFLSENHQWENKVKAFKSHSKFENLKSCFEFMKNTAYLLELQLLSCFPFPSSAPGERQLMSAELVMLQRGPLSSWRQCETSTTSHQTSERKEVCTFLLSSPRFVSTSTSTSFQKGVRR